MAQAQLGDFVAESSDLLLFCPIAHVGRANGAHGPVIRLPVQDESSDTGNRVVDALREFVANRLADFDVGLTDKVVCGRVPTEVGRAFATETSLV
jgi:hypothetical protein